MPAAGMAEDATQTIMDHVDQITAELDALTGKQPERDLKETLEGIIGKLTEIQVALQFQDITSQHLRQAAQIVEAIQVRLEKLFESLRDIGEKNELLRTIVESYAAEGEEEAIETGDTIRRDDAISQADIDALFGNQ